MNCPDRDQLLLAAYGDSELSSELEEHLSECELCRGALNEIQADYSAIDRELIDGLLMPSSKVDAAILQRATAHKATLVRGRFLRPLLSAAALLLIAINVAFFMQPRSQTIDFGDITAEAGLDYLLWGYDSDLAILEEFAERRMEEALDAGETELIEMEREIYARDFEEILNIL